MAGKRRTGLTLALLIATGILTFLISYTIFFREMLFEALRNPQTEYNKYAGTRFPLDSKINSSDGSRMSIENIFEMYPDKNIIFNFWATWCGPCVHELPSIEAMIPTFLEQGTRIVLVNYDSPNRDRSLKDVPKWLQENGFDLETFYDFDSELLTRLKISALPVSIAVDAKEKKIRWLRIGEIDWSNPKADLSFTNE